MTTERNNLITKNHGLIFKFLRIKRLAFDEYYDIVVFGFIEAARRYTENPQLRENYPFQTIAFRKMNDCLSAHFRKLRNERKYLSPVNLEHCPEELLHDSFNLEDTVVDKIFTENLCAVFGRTEMCIVSGFLKRRTQENVRKSLKLSYTKIREKRDDIKTKLHYQLAA